MHESCVHILIKSEKINQDKKGSKVRKKRPKNEARRGGGEGRISTAV